MTLSQATREAVRRFGKGSKCQSYPGGRRIQICLRTGSRVTFNHPPGTDWVTILDGADSFYRKATAPPEAGR